MHAKELPELNGPRLDMVGVMDDSGYEWVEHNEKQWYRVSPESTWEIYADESSSEG